MVKINLLVVGRLKENYWKDAENEYIKRLSPYMKFGIVEIPEVKFKNSGERANIIKQEGGLIVPKIPNDSFIVTLDQKRGKSFDSIEFSKKLYDWSQLAQSMSFIIGGPLGLSQEVLGKSNQIISLSRMTFTHQMSRVILLEQIYRGIMISHNRTYHY